MAKRKKKEKKGQTTILQNITQKTKTKMKTKT